MPLPAIVVGLAGSTVVRYVVGSAIVYVAGTEVIGRFSSGADEMIEEFEAGLMDIGVNIVDRVGEGLVDVIEFGGVAAMKGAKLAYQEGRKSFLENTTDVAMATTIGGLTLLSFVWLYSNARKGEASI